MFEQFTQILTQNEFMQGGLLMVILGATLAYLRQLPQIWWAFFLRRISVTLTIQERHNTFNLVENWILNQIELKRCRRLFFKSLKLKNEDSHTILPNYGNHWFWYKYRPILFNRSKHENKSGSSTIVQDEVYIQIFFASPLFVYNIIDEIYSHYKEETYKSTKINIAGNTYWRLLTRRPLIKHEPILKDNQFQILKKDILKFKKSETKYADLGIFYKRNYLFYGKPGNGKTSSVLALAQACKKHLAIIDLSKSGNAYIEDLVCELPRNSILVLEDIDRIKTLQNETLIKDTKDDLKEMFQANLTTILNVLDGLMTPHGLITIATTNHVEKLDDALIRPGRFDVKTEISTPTELQKQLLCERFQHPYSKEISEARSMSEVQQLIFG